MPDFDFNLNGDTFGPIGTNTLSKSAIVEKPVLDVTTPPTSSEIVINAVKDESDSLPMTKISAKDFIINAYAAKDNALEEDRLVISDSEDSDELKVIEIIETQKASVYLVKNQTGGTLLKGKVARAVGVLGASGRILIDYAIADGTHLPKFTIGVIYEDIPNGEDGYVMAFGQIRNVNTNAFNEGDVLWLSPSSAGDFVSTKPTAPDYKVILALVIRKDATNGIIQVRVNVGEFLTDLHDVENGGSTGDALVKQASGLYDFAKVKPSDLAQDGAADGEVLTWNDTAGQWEPGAGGGGGGGDTVTGDETRGIEVTEPTAGNKVVAKKYYNVFESFTASMALELKEGRRHIFTATSDFTLANPTNVESFEGRVEIIITQGLGGGHQITAKGDRVIFPNNTLPTLNSTFGESDWLRGICVNGYLLIYQIESLAAPGIDVEPPPAAPASTDVVVYSFLQYDDSFSSPARIERIQDGVEKDLSFFNGIVNSNEVYDFLKLSNPVSTYAEINTDNFWVDQSGNSFNITSWNRSAPLKLTKINGLFGLQSFFSNPFLAQPIISSEINGANELGFFMVMKYDAVGSDAFFSLTANGINTYIFAFRFLNNTTMVAQARQNTTDTLKQITLSYTPNLFLLSATINFLTGEFKAYVNGVLQGTETLDSTGSVPTDIWRAVINRQNVTASYYHAQITKSADNTDRQNLENYLIESFNINNTTQTGQNIYELFDVIISADRYNYSPYAARIRESATNTEEVISHDSTTGLFDVTAFDAHVGAGNGFVTTMVNQASPWQAFTRTTAARQLQLVKNVFNGRVALQGSNSARTSIQTTSIRLDTKALHYYYFIPVILDSLSASRDSIFSQMFPSNRALNLMGIVNVSGNARLEVSGRRLDTDSFRGNTGTTNLATGTAYLFTFYYDYENGIWQARINQALEINDTSAYSGTSIDQINISILGTNTDNTTLSFNGKIGGLFFHQGELTSAQRIAIENELMNTYGIT